VAAFEAAGAGVDFEEEFFFAVVVLVVVVGGLGEAVDPAEPVVWFFGVAV